MPRKLWRTLHWFKKIRHSNISCIIEEFFGFPWKTFSLTVPKNFVGERFCLSEKFQCGKSLWIRRGCHVLPSKFFCSKTPKNIVGEPFCDSETFWYEKFLDNRGITILLNFFCLTSPKSTVGEHVCVSELFWFQNFLDNRGVTILSFVFVSQCRKISGKSSNDSKAYRVKFFMQNSGVSRFSVGNFQSHSTEKLV